MRQDRISQIVRFALARAKQEDHGFQDLGVIHILKLLYLADLAYARTHGGATFTEVPWIFFHFGPWERESWGFCGTVLDAPEIEKRARGGAFERTTFRLVNEEEADHLYQELDRTLPSEVSREVRWAVHEFGTDTKRLLHHVYKTEPMLRAVPGQPIDFSGFQALTYQGQLAPVVPAPSRTQQKRAEEAKRQLRDSIAEKAAVRQAARVVPLPGTRQRF